MNYVYWNGDFTRKDQLRIDPSNRAFRFGDGFFETIRCAQGKPLWMKYHFNRILKSMDLLKLNIKYFSDQKSLEHIITHLLEINDQQQGVRLRISFFRDASGNYKPNKNDLGMLIETFTLDHLRYKSNNTGLMMGIFEDMIKNNDPLSHLKTSSALIYVLASVYAESKKWDDCFLLNESGFIAEATSSNVFMVKNNQLFTPDLDQNCVAGVMRNVVADIASHNGYKISECALHAQDLLKADEVFLTNTINGIRWVKGLGVKRYFHEIAEKIVFLINKEVDRYLNI